jgi:hypothetical protein
MLGAQTLVSFTKLMRRKACLFLIAWAVDSPGKLPEWNNPLIPRGVLFSYQTSQMMHFPTSINDMSVMNSLQVKLSAVQALILVGHLEFIPFHTFGLEQWCLLLRTCAQRLLA